MDRDTESTLLLPDTVLIPWRNAPLTIGLRRGEPTPEGGGGGGAFPSPVTTTPIIIFINGLGSARDSWSPSLHRLPKRYTTLTYNRFGQGDTPPLPADVPDDLRDGAAAARDLYELILELTKRQNVDDDAAKTMGDLASADIILVAHSIGVAIARLLLANHKDIGPAVKGALFLDPSIVNSDFVSLYPPPRDGEPEELTRTREATRKVFHPSAPNRERFNRTTFARLLPLAEKPALEGDPYLTVVAHDPTVAFGEASERMGISTKYARQYVEPYWQDYNKKLLLSVLEGRRRGPVVADGADHFVHVDRPDLVAEEIVRLVDLVGSPR